MPKQVLMPSLGESVEEGTVTKWLKEPGDNIDEYEPLLEVNTDKVDSEIPSPFSGILLEILIPEGATVQAGEPLAWIGEAGEVVPGANGESDQKPKVERVKAAPPVEDQAEQPQPEKQAVKQDELGRGSQGFISPIVGRIASEYSVDLTKVEGTGQGGRITKKDILAYVERMKGEGDGRQAVSEPSPIKEAAPSTKPAEPARAEPGLTGVPGEVLPLTAVRKAIADHMVHSKHTSPHVTTVMEVDLSKVVAHREANKAGFARDGINLTFTAYFISAAIAALKAYPIVNSSWSEGGILLHRQIHIGMATALGEGGLIVPVIKNADDLSLVGLARQINDLANRARNRKLQPDEVKGGTFTITNHGTSGSLFATPIINQPQCGILGVGAIQKRVVVIEDAIAIRPMVYVSLTFDHRILDGAIADYFLGAVVKSLEEFQG
jgi:2-oxoglutarate dehydrogenase dihydrolipoamide succinyltransferase (E2 component)